METPSARIVSTATATMTVTDADGRSLVLRRLSALDKLRLFKAVGPHLAQNAPYLGMATLAMSVCAIDGVPMPPPVTEAQIEALVSRLGDAGIAAAAGALHQPEAPESHAGKLSRHPDLVDSLYLVRNGVPFDVAFSLDPEDRLAWIVALGTLDGGEFDWASRSWKQAE